MLDDDTPTASTSTATAAVESSPQLQYLTLSPFQSQPENTSLTRGKKPNSKVVAKSRAQLIKLSSSGDD